MSKPRSFTAYPLGPALEFLQRLWQLNQSLEKLSGSMNRRLGVTAQQRFIVRCLGKYPGITAGQLASMLHVDPGTISAALRRLEHKSLIERRRDPRDRRRVTLGLTRRARELDHAAPGTIEHAVERLLLTEDAGNVAIAIRILERLTAELTEDYGLIARGTCWSLTLENIGELVVMSSAHRRHENKSA